jgi:hypothetical protein
VSHPSLGEIKGRPRRGLSGTVVTVLDVGIPVITVLKDAVEIIGAVPFLKPVLAAVLVMSQAARVRTGCLLWHSLNIEIVIIF